MEIKQITMAYYQVHSWSGDYLFLLGRVGAQIITEVVQIFSF